MNFNQRLDILLESWKELGIIDPKVQAKITNRYVIINTEENYAIPLNSENEVRIKLIELLQNVGLLDQTTIPDEQTIGKKYGVNMPGFSKAMGIPSEEDIYKVPTEKLGEIHPEIFYVHEGSQGVWSNYMSSDRQSIGGPLPTDNTTGSSDMIIYQTVGKPSGTIVRGKKL